MVKLTRGLKIRTWLPAPMFWIVLIAAVLRLIGLGWGLPASDGWDSDGIAPRDFLVGVVKTYTPGDYFTYPPFHLLILTILTCPGWIAGIINAPSMAPADIVSEFIKIPYMTFFALVARLVSAAMSLGTIYCVGKIGEELAGRRGGICVAGVCALNATLTYYGHTTNLDGPYLFWASLAILFWIRVMVRHDLSQIRWMTLCIVAAIATKDQAYALFLLNLPSSLILWFARDVWPRDNALKVFSTILVWSLIGLFLLLLVDGATTNPAGFRARVDFLSGNASQPHAYYSSNLSGYLQLLEDGWRNIDRYYPKATVVFVIIGLCAWIFRFRKSPGLWVAGLVPFLAAISFTLSFNFVALRSESRFLLPQSIFLAVYAGLAINELMFAKQRSVAVLSRLGVLTVGFVALFYCLAIDAAFLNDPRYVAERWLEAHASRDDLIETYGPNVYLPRFHGPGHVTRVDQTPIGSRSRLPGVTESAEPFELAVSRAPRFIVLSEFWAIRYLTDENEFSDSGRISSAEQKAHFREAPARKYFRDLRDEKLPYRIRYEAGPSSDFWPPVRVHESINEKILIFERIADK
ncbi:ArnT family glycosyltransferase [Afipia sp. DC4300-2b1]|uniref:ArnT family glycosyltransferase n=1 Tax=Afipia sp. DC4300-2b1 TaxID=2804672 RepID=UPI003CFA3D58